DDHPYYYEDDNPSRRQGVSDQRSSDAAQGRQRGETSQRPSDLARPRDGYRASRAGDDAPLADDAALNSSGPPLQSQFPGQVPDDFSAPYRPPESPGLAADYYGDQGESVLQQPGVRPDVLVNSQPHLMTPSAVAAPPEETGHGSAADYYSADNQEQP